VSTHQERVPTIRSPLQFDFQQAFLATDTMTTNGIAAISSSRVHR
jgi:hypothetical protein